LTKSASTGSNGSSNAKVLIIGAGGLGSPAALYLASAGVGRITLADGDTVDLTNLQRQILHTQERIGQAKALSGQTALRGVNPEVHVEAIASHLAGEALAALVADADVVLDCCDNFATRHAVNRACVRHRTPLVSGAAIRFAGQLRYSTAAAITPLLQLPVSEGEDVDQVRCAVMGVFAPLTGIIGAMQAAEALKLITGAGEVVAGPSLAARRPVDGMAQRQVRPGPGV
jgi:molybdopterin/thiamine biosynthesis adenylyltransferase